VPNSSIPLGISVAARTIVIDNLRSAILLALIPTSEWRVRLATSHFTACRYPYSLLAITINIYAVSRRELSSKKFGYGIKTVRRDSIPEKPLW